MNKKLFLLGAIVISLGVVILFSIQIKGNEKEVLKTETFELGEYYRIAVVDEINGTESKDYCVPLESMKQLIEYNETAAEYIKAKNLNIDEQTFSKKQVWYLRLYAKDDRVPVLDLVTLHHLSDKTAILEVALSGYNTYDFKEEDNFVAYTEYVFMTDKNVQDVQIVDLMMGVQYAKH